MIKMRKKKPGFLEKILLENTTLPAYDRQQGLSFLVSLFNEIRPAPGKKKNPENNLKEVTVQLKTHSLLLQNTQYALLSQLATSKLTNAITESGIPLARGFWQELSNRLKHKILPPLQDEDDFLYVLNNVFYKKSDFKWVESIERQAWVQFFETIGFNAGIAGADIRRELLRSLKYLSFQVAQLGLERVVTAYISRDDDEVTPFVSQNYRVNELEELLQQNASEAKLKTASAGLKGEVENCYRLIEQIREGHTEKGASIQQTYILLILSNRLQRMQLITDVLDADEEFDTGRFVDVFRMLIRNEKRKNSVLEFLSQGVGYLAYQIAEHKGTKGHRYITSTRKEYRRMVRSAMIGGVIISFIAILKNLIGKLKLAPFPMGFLFSVNYSAGFILIDETKSTLATKQPAFTASAVASSLDAKKYAGEPDLNNLAATIAKVSRSQIASFFGNLIIVFPLTFLLAWAYHEFTHKPIAEGEAAFKLLRDQHPWRSPALLYASFTGFFLFASGIIAGYWQNKIRYGQIKERLIKHPALKHSFSQRRLEKWGGYIEKNFGALMGSIALGFFLGFSGIIGKIIGVPFDIRHITISAGNAAIGVYGLGIENIPSYFMLAVFFGVLGIGFINFLISFSLAFIVAVKSRGIHLSQYPKLFRVIMGYFAAHPREFFLPAKKKAMPVYQPLKPAETDQEE